MRRQLALGLLLALGWTVPAHAQNDPNVLIDQGVSLREQRKDQEALELFERAERQAPTPRGRAQVALAEQALGRWALAEKDLSLALSADADPWIAKYKSVLEEALSTVRAHLGDLILHGGVAGAEVKVDGASVGVLPVTGPLRLVVGTHTLEARADGYYPFSQPVTIRADAPAAVSLDMQRLAEQALPKPVITPVVVPLPPRVERAPSGGGQRVVGIVLAVSSVAPLALGFVALGARSGEVSAYNADATCPGLSSATQPGSCQSHIDAAGAWQATAIAGFVVAGALAVTGVILALIAPRAHRPAVALTVPF